MQKQGSLAQTVQALGKLDLNLLLVLHALSETGHVGRAAKALNLSQPAVSHALARLRETLGDPLFVRGPKGVVPTAKTERLAPVVASLLGTVRRDVLQSETDDLASVERTFVIRTTGMTEALLLAKLETRLAAEAPRIQVLVKEATSTFPSGELERGECDLAIAGFFQDVPKGCKRQVLFTDDFVTAVRRGHPRITASTGLSLEEFCAERHILVAPGGDLRAQVDAQLEKKKQQRFVAVGVADFLSAGWVVAGTDCILTGPGSLIRHFKTYLDLVTFEPPVKLAPITVAQIWHERNHNDRVHAWMRAQIEAILKGKGRS